MKTKHVMFAAVVASIVSVVVACSSDDDASAPGFSCPKVGQKNCPNDQGATQTDADFCKQCESQSRKYQDCLGGPPACGADGKSASVDLTKCKTELQAVITCFTGGTTTDAGGSSDAATGG